METTLYVIFIIYKIKFIIIRECKSVINSKVNKIVKNRVLIYKNKYPIFYGFYTLKIC